VHFVQRADVPGQALDPVHQAAVQAAYVRRGGPPGQVEGRAEVTGDPLPVPGAFVNVQHHVTQVHALEPGQHGVDGGAFLRHEQDLPAACHQRGDQVGDGLALAGAGRPVDDQALAGQHGVDGVALGGVGVQDGVVVLR